MSVWIIISILLLFGLLLMIAEIILIPGTTLVGLLGVMASIVGIFISFQQLGAQTGLFVLISFLVVSITALYYSFQSKIWRRFALTDRITSRVNEDDRILLLAGDQGRALSALRPSGKAEFTEGIVEVHSVKNFIDAGCRIEVVRLEDNKIYVQPLGSR